MVKSIKQLKAERDRLLRGSDARKLKSNAATAALLERKSLENDIRRLKNPRLASAGAGIGKFARATGKFLKERANIVTANIEREMREERARAARQGKRPTTRTKPRKKVTRAKTSSRRIRR